MLIKGSKPNKQKANLFFLRFVKNFFRHLVSINNSFLQITFTIQ